MILLFLYIPLNGRAFHKDNIMLKTLQGPLKGIILAVQMHKIVFISLTCPRGAALEYYLPFLHLVTFFIFLFFFRTNQLPYIECFTDLLGKLSGCLTKKPFHSISPSAGSHFQVFWGSFWSLFIHFLGAVPSYPIKCFVDVFCINLTVKVLRKIS